MCFQTEYLYTWGRAKLKMIGEFEVYMEENIRHSFTRNMHIHVIQVYVQPSVFICTIVYMYSD